MACDPIDCAVCQVDVEVSFIGDVVNLAARLEKACEVNGALISNRAKGDLDREGVVPVPSLSLTSRRLTSQQAKGQLTAVQAWQVPEAALDCLRTLS